MMNIELFKDAIAIVGGIPEERISLSSFQDGMEFAETAREITCGTLACAAGWLSLHPDMQALGLRVGPYGDPVYAHHDSGFESLAEFFGMTEDQARLVFGSRYSWKCRIDSADLSDKELWLARAHQLLEEVTNGKNKTV